MTNFQHNESGAVTVDWVVLTAALVGLGLAVAGVVSSGVENVSGDIDAELRRGDIIRTSFEQASTSTGISSIGVPVLQSRALSCPDGQGGFNQFTDSATLSDQNCTIFYLIQWSDVTLENGDVVQVRQRDNFALGSYSDTEMSYFVKEDGIVTGEFEGDLPDSLINYAAEVDPIDLDFAFPGGL